MIVWKNSDAKAKVGLTTKKNVWPSYVGGNNSPSSIVWFGNVAWVYDLICSIGWKHVYIIHAFYVKKQVSESIAWFDCCCVHYMVKGI